jgi:hypothetical protein
LDPLIDAKRRATNLLRYGNEEAIISSSVKEKISKTNVQRYGLANAVQAEYSEHARNVLFDPNAFEHALSGMTLDEAKDQLGVSLRTILNYANRYDLRGIFTNVKITRPEQWMVDLLDGTEFCDQYVRNSKNTIPPQELDFFIPSVGLAIEVNGLYWHSELGGKKARSYHHNKWRSCLQHGITLLQFSDHDIAHCPHLVRSRVLRYLGCAVPVIGARKLEIHWLDDYDVEQQFLTQWHIQGPNSSRTSCLAAYHQGSMIGLSTWKTVGSRTELVRYATDVNRSYPGLMSRMIKQFLRYNPQVRDILSYSSNDHGSGRLYQSCGFQLDGYTAPGYRYTKDYISTESRMKYQRHKLSEMFGMQFDDTLSEWQIMQSLGYDRIWDSGNTRWRLHA